MLAGLIDIRIDDPVLWRFFAELIPLLVMVVFTVVFLLIEKRKIKIPVIQNIGRGTLIGSLSGIIWIGVAAGILVLTKQLTITAKNDIPMLWLWILSAFINVIMQELLDKRIYISALENQIQRLGSRDSYNAVIHTDARRSICGRRHSGYKCNCNVPVYNGAL